MGDRSAMHRVAIASIVLVAASTAMSARGAPFVPADDSVVLETGLPNADPRVRQMRSLADDLKARPDDLGIAMQLAGRQLAMGVAEADPRFVGYAEASLGPWWRDPAPATTALVLRARIKQAQHKFTDAAADLRAALRQEPNNLTALLVLASVDEVSGDFAEAKQACATFAAAHPGLAATACSASVAGVTGDAASSGAALADAVRNTATWDRSVQVWALTILAEIATRLDDPKAESYYEAARGIDGRNVYLLTAFADYLLDHGRPDRDISLLLGFERIDPLYLRLALAAQAAHDPRFPSFRDGIAGRLAAARRQGDQLHLRDDSRFALEIEHDAAGALSFAKQNWATHKTPADARVLVDAAIAGQDPSAAAPVAEFVANTHLEDKALARRLASLGFGAE